jgi:hypothetical protein
MSNSENTTHSSLGLPVVESLGGREASVEFVERVPIHFARQHGVLASRVRTVNFRWR